MRGRRVREILSSLYTHGWDYASQAEGVSEAEERALLDRGYIERASGLGEHYHVTEMGLRIALADRRL